jgi:F-type H+-transporting ATPase subunit b
VRRELVARAEEEANDVRTRAQGDIALQRERALAELRTDVANLSIELAERIVERNLDHTTQMQLVDSFIDQVGRN